MFSARIIGPILTNASILRCTQITVCLQGASSSKGGNNKITKTYSQNKKKKPYSEQQTSFQSILEDIILK